MDFNNTRKAVKQTLFFNRVPKVIIVIIIIIIIKITNNKS